MRLVVFSKKNKIPLALKEEENFQNMPSNTHYFQDMPPNSCYFQNTPSEHEFSSFHTTPSLGVSSVVVGRPAGAAVSRHRCVSAPSSVVRSSSCQRRACPCQRVIVRHLASIVVLLRHRLGELLGEVRAGGVSGGDGNAAAGDKRLMVKQHDTRGGGTSNDAVANYRRGRGRWTTTMAD